MRLVELQPRWYVAKEGGHRVGLTFLCPHCQTIRLGVAFHHEGIDAIKDDEPETSIPGAPSWTITNDDDMTSFENVSLHPSIDTSHFGHWHGFILNGATT